MSLWRKTWCETRARFALAAGALVAMNVVAIAQAGSWPASLEHRAALLSHLAYGEPSATLFVLLIVTLGGGSLRQERALGTLGFTLALPVTRRHLVLARAAVGAVEIFAVVAISALAAAVATQVLAGAAPLRWIVESAAVWTMFGVVVLALSMLCSTWVESEAVAWLGAFLAVMAYEAIVALTPLRAVSGLDFYRLLGGERLLRDGMPWSALAAMALITAALLAASIFHARRSEP